MKIRTLAVVLAAALVLPTAASAAPPDELSELLSQSDYAQQVGLTIDDPDAIPPGVMSDADFAKLVTRKEFVANAIKTSGITGADARAAYADPVLRALVPLNDTKTEVLSVPPPKDALTAQFSAYKWRARIKCVTTSLRASVGTHAKFTHCKRWQYNGSRTRNASVWTRTWRAKWSPMVYEGVVSAGGHYSSWRGHTRGQHWSYRAGAFTHNLPWAGQRILSSEVYGRYNGSVYSRNLGTS